MRVILTVNFSPWSPYYGGGQRSTHELASAHARRGHDVTVVYTRPPWESFPVPDDLPYRVRWAAFAGVRSRSGALLRPLTAISVAREVGRLIEADRRETVVHVQGDEGALVARLKQSARFGLVVSPRDTYPVAMRSGSRSPIARLRRILVPPKYHFLGIALRAADRWCPTSRATAEAVRDIWGVSPERCTVVPNGVAHTFLEIDRARDAAEGPIVFFGRLDPVKGGDVLVRALARLGTDAPRAVVVGRGPEEKRLRAIAQAGAIADRVDFVGWREPADLARILAGARMAVLPSRGESFGNAMVEAMAAAVPLVTTRVGAVPELVIADHTGVIVPPDDPGALHAAIQRMLDDPAAAEAMGRAARTHVRERYSWDATARAFEEVYAQALGDAA